MPSSRTLSCRCHTTKWSMVKGLFSARCREMIGKNLPTCASSSDTCLLNQRRSCCEWAHDGSLDWDLAQHDRHNSLQRWVAELNRFYRSEPALYEQDLNPSGFEWIDCNDSESGVISFIRKGHSSEDIILVVCNFTPVPRQNYRLGTPRGGFWKELLNSDAVQYSGSGWGNFGGVEAVPIPLHGRSHSVTLTLPPLAALFFKHDNAER